MSSDSTPVTAACVACIVIICFFGSIIISPYIAIDTCSWLEDFEEWSDDLHEIVSETTTSCTNESELYGIIDDIGTFAAIAYMYAVVAVYYTFVILLMCCGGGLKLDWDIINICSKPKIVLLNWIIHNGMTIAFLWQYYLIKDLVDNISNDIYACGTRYSSTLLESETYYQHLTTFPTSAVLTFYIIEIVSFCGLMYIAVKIAGMSGDSTAAGGATAGATGTSAGAGAVATRDANVALEFRGMFAGAMGSAGATGRGRTDSEQKAAVIVGALVVTIYGFEFATKENCDDAMRKLARINCGNQTALRDAIALGIGRMIDLKRHLTRLNAFDHNFIHIVLTDGEDNKSKIEKGKFLALQTLLDRENFDQICKTIFIGVGLNNQAERDLRLYSILGGKQAEFRKCNDVMEIESIFEHISVNLIQRTRVAAVRTEHGTLMMGSRQNAAVLGLNHFLVLFTLDISGSMAGSRWNAVKRATRKILDNLKASDLFGINLFNDKTKMITGRTEDS